MRKLMLLAAVMAMVLAAAAPAFAQANAVGGSVQYVDCDQIQAAATGQYNANNQQDLAGIAQELGVDENQVLACFQSIAAGNDVNINTASASTVTVTAKATSTSTAKSGGGGGGGGSASAASAAGGALPSTGGASLLALGAGALLVAGGLLARRIVRQ
jgi:alanyl-tRNA synthetase